MWAPARESSQPSRVRPPLADVTGFAPARSPPPARAGDRFQLSHKMPLPRWKQRAGHSGVRVTSAGAGPGTWQGRCLRVPWLHPGPPALPRPAPSCPAALLDRPHVPPARGTRAHSWLGLAIDTGPSIATHPSLGSDLI